MRRLLAALAALGLLAAAPLPPAPVRPVPPVADPVTRSWPAPESHSLSSGAPVRVLPRPQVPLVRVEVSLPWDGAGASLQEQLAAAMMGQLLKAGTLHRSGAELDAALDRLGARWNTGMTTSRLWGEVEVPVGAEDQALGLLREVLLEPALDRDEARRIQDRWATWRDGLGLDIARTHGRAVNHAWFPHGHPSRHSATPKDLRKLKPRHVTQLHQRVLAEARPRLVVVGDTSAERILPLLEQAFGHLDGEAVGGPIPAVEPTAKGWLVNRAGFDVARLTVALPGPPLGHPDAPLADLLMGVLASEFTSRIPMDLRETRGLAYSVWGQAHSWRGAGRLRVDAEVDAARAAEALLAVEAHLDRLLAEGPAGLGEAELRAARNTLLIHSDRRLETVRAAADTLGELLILDRELDDLRAERARIAAATAVELHDVARRWLDPAGRVWILTGERARIEPALEGADRVPDRIVGASTLAGEP